MTLSIERNCAPVNKILPYSVVDGPGNRVSVFLQRCNIHCAYCHNPETQQICCGCGVFVEGCPAHALTLSGGNWFYTDARFGPKYFTFVTEELPLFVEKIFPVSRRREDRFIAGPSMGGYGAAKCALRCPNKYAAFGDLSGAVDPEALYPQMVAMGFDSFRYDLIFGNDHAVPEEKEDVYRLAQSLAGLSDTPDAYIFCGLEDTANYEMNRKLAASLEDAGFRTVFRDGHGGHDWDYWDRCIRHFLQVVSA